MSQTNWNDFNGAVEEYKLVPQGTISRVNLKIKRSLFNSPEYPGYYATQGKTNGSIYLNVEYTMLDAPYKGRKIFGMIGLYTPKGPTWGTTGRVFIKRILESAHGLDPKDDSPGASELRIIKDFGALEELIFAAVISIEPDLDGIDRNTIRTATRNILTKEHPLYHSVMNGTYDNASEFLNASW